MDLFSKTLPKWEGIDLPPPSQWPKIHNYSNIDTECILLMQEVLYRDALKIDRSGAIRLAKDVPIIFVDHTSQLNRGKEKFAFPGDFVHSSFRVACLPVFLRPPSSALEAICENAVDHQRMDYIKSRICCGIFGVRYLNRIPKVIQRISLTVRLERPPIPRALRDEIWIRCQEIKLESQLFDQTRRKKAIEHQLGSLEEERVKTEKTLAQVRESIRLKSNLLLGGPGEKNS